MTDHNELSIIFDGVFERDKVASIELFAGAIDDGKIIMRIDFGIAVTREVFKGGSNSVIFKTFGEGLGHCGNDSWVGRETATADDGIIRIGVDIGIGSGVNIDTYRAEFFGKNMTDSASVINISGLANGVHVGDVGGL